MKQYTLVLSTFISASFFSCSTLAHDSVSHAWNWNGFYAGINAGLVQHTLSMTDNQATTFNATIEEVSNPKASGGFQVGYRRQLTPSPISGLYGFEFSANYSDAKFTKEYGSPFALYQLTSTNTLKNNCLFELIGGIAAEKALLFFAAGFSWSKIEGNTINLDGIPFFDSFTMNKQSPGAVVGGGVEYAFNDKLSARLKVDYIMPNAYSVFDTQGDAFQISNTITQGNIGINYQFG